MSTLQVRKYCKLLHLGRCCFRSMLTSNGMCLWVLQNINLSTIQLRLRSKPCKELTHDCRSIFLQCYRHWCRHCCSCRRLLICISQDHFTHEWEGVPGLCWGLINERKHLHLSGIKQSFNIQ